MPVIYIDVLLALNLFIDFLLLSVTARIRRRPHRRWRTVLGALFGAACSCLIFLPDMPPVLSVAVNTGCWSHRRGTVRVHPDLSYELLTHEGVEL